MSSIWKKPTFSLRQQENNWIGIVFSTHDAWCHCEDVWLHLMIILNKQGNAPKPESEVENIKCLLTGTDTATTKEDHTEEDVVTGFNDGELEKLFAEDGTEENGDEGTR